MTQNSDTNCDNLVDYRNYIQDNRRWRRFVHRPGDIVVCTSPKCGTTWMQTIVTTLLFGGKPLAMPVVMLAPWIDMRLPPLEQVLEELASQTHRRCMKTHTPADGIPWFEDTSYIVVGRDGRDAFMSWVNHVRSMRPDVAAELRRTAVEEGIPLDPPPPADDIHAFFEAWLAQGHLFHLVDTYWRRRDQPNVCFVHFNDLKTDLAGQMRRVAAFLDIDIPDADWPQLVELCTFASMKARPKEIGPFEIVFQGGAGSFLHKGTNERWREILTKAEVDAYHQRAAALLPHDAAAWLSGSTALRP